MLFLPISYRVNGLLGQVQPERMNTTDLELLYHGRIDNSRREDDVDSKDLRKALDEILAGKPVSVTDTLINLFNDKWRGAVPATFIYDENGIQKTFLLGKQS